MKLGDKKRNVWKKERVRKNVSKICAAKKLKEGLSMTKENGNVQKKEKGITINMLVFILGILICASILTYIIPAGQFDMNEETKTLIPGTFHLVDQTPVNIWKALLNIFDGMTKSAKVMSIVIFMGGALKVIISTGAVQEFLNWAIYKLQKREL